MALKNLECLINDMVIQDWTICSFIFNYKKIEYIVLVRRFLGTERKIDKNSLAKLHFMKSYDLNDDLQVEADKSYLKIGAKKLREYFGIKYQENLGSILQQFTDRLGNAIPLSVPDNNSTLEKTVMVQALSKSDSENPNKIYCTKVRRNPNGGQRSKFNSDKTKLLRRSLFRHFCNNSEISFCYSLDSAKENDDATILRNFAVNNSN